MMFTGSPFTVKISGEGRVKESITRTRRAPSVATVGSICDLNLKIPGKQGPHPHNHNLHSVLEAVEINFGVVKICSS